MDFKEIEGLKHYIYDDKAEFNIHHASLPLRHYWRQGVEGEWIYTDDDYVCQILRKLSIKDGANNPTESIRTVCGTFVVSDPNKKMLGENGIAENIYSFSGNYGWQEELKGKNCSSKQLLFARYVASGMGAIKAYKLAYPKAQSEGYVKKRIDKLLKTEKIQKMVKEEIREILDDEGVTNNWLIERYKTIADLAESDTAKLRSLDSLAKISGLFDTDEKKSEQVTVWAGFSPEQLEGVGKNGKQPELIAHAEREED